MDDDDDDDDHDDDDDDHDDDLCYLFGIKPLFITWIVFDFQLWMHGLSEVFS